MKTALALALVLALIASHIVATVFVFRTKGGLRAALCMLFPVLAPLWAWDAGARKVALSWCAAFLLYALFVVVV